MLNTPSTSSLSFELSLQHAAQSITNNPRAAEAFVKDILSILDGERPASILSPIATGAFKECYDSKIPGYIVKFCSANNDTDTEARVLDLAAISGLGPLFLPTQILALPHPIEARLLSEYNVTEPEYSENYDDEGIQYLTHLQIQPKVIICPKSAVLEDAAHCYLDGTVIPPKSIDMCSLSNSDWIREAVAYHGDEIMHNFFDFAEALNLNDLHNGNVGYLDDAPVIVDWMSNGGFGASASPWGRRDLGGFSASDLPNEV